MQDKQSNAVKAGKFRYGFTLIELLVVVAIIAVLISILLPSLGTAREQARKITCGSNLGQVSRAILTYANDYNDMIPAMFTKQGGKNYACSSFGPYVTYDSLALLVKKTSRYGLSSTGYLMDCNPFFCPNDKTFALRRQPKEGWGYNSSGNRGISYWYFYVSPGGLDAAQVGSGTTSGWWAGLERYSTSNNIRSKAFANLNLDNQPAKICILFDGSAAPSMVSSASWPMFHPTGWNVLYIDGHVKWQSLDSVNYELQSRSWFADLLFEPIVFDIKG